MTMKILINALLLNSRFSGVQYSTEHLLHTLTAIGSGGHEITVLTGAAYQSPLAGNAGFNTEKVSFDTANRPARILFEHFRLPGYFRRKGFQLYHATGYILPWFADMPSVLTVHDLIALDHPEYCKTETALYYRTSLPRSIKKADRIIAVSYTVKQDILRRFNIPPDRITVIYHGVDPSFQKVTHLHTLNRVRLKYNLPDRYILFVGNLEPKKNLGRLIDAYLWLKKGKAIPHKLLIVGQDGWKTGDVLRKITTSGPAPDIVSTGYVDREDLPAIYSMSALFAFPSLYEGFGMPVLEAMACGVPVLVSNAGALPEIAGNISPRVDPTSVAAIAEGILRLLGDEQLRTTNIRYGLHRAGSFTWENTAWQTLEVYNHLLQ
jgi:glycosyltransferase involved in cell wall biosynthesis